MERDRETVARLTTGSRLWWMWIGAGVWWIAITIVQLVWHGSVNP
jgi:hypothetical protein